jgi:tetratricopeptide (TPR) repeat protein
MSHLDEWEILDLLTALVDKSLVIYEEDEHGVGRYRLLQTTRQYAHERLTEEGEEERQKFRQQHRDWFLSLVEEARPQLEGPQQAVWFERLETEHDNLRVALQWCVENGEAETGLKIGAALWRFWSVRGHLREGRERLVELLNMPGADARTKARADALNGAGNLAHTQGDYAAARAFHEESLTIRREIGDQRGVAGSLGNLGNVAHAQSDYAAARAFYEQSLDISRTLSNRAAEAINLCCLGNLCADQGDYAGARASYEQSLVIARELGNRWLEAHNLNNLGLVASAQGDYATAQAHYEQALVIARELGNRGSEAYNLNRLGLAACRQRDYARARALCEESLSLSREVGVKGSIAWSLHILGLVACREGDTAAARVLLAESLTVRWELGDKVGITDCLEGMAKLAFVVATSVAPDETAKAVTTSGMERAARLWGAAESLCEAIGSPMSPADRADYERNVAAARAALGEESFTAAWAEGRKMTMEEAVEYALNGPCD